MKKKSTLLIAFVCLFAWKYLPAQDPFFSQFYANRLYLNPAYAGFDPGISAIINYRNQWPGIPDGDASAYPSSYSTINASADWQLPCFTNADNFNMGLAASLFRDDAGTAPLTIQGAGIAYSAAKRIETGAKNHIKFIDIRLGTQLSFMQRHINNDFFIYSDLLDPYFGLINGPEVLSLRSRVYPNLNAGVMMNMGNDNFTFTSGFSISNILEPNQALYDSSTDELLPQRFTYHLGANIELGSNFFIAPQARADVQSDFDLSHFAVGSYVQGLQYYLGAFFQFNRNNNLQNSPMGSEFGLSSNVNHLVLTAGVDIKNIIYGTDYRTEQRRNSFVLGITYDASLGGLNQNTTLGGFEINIRMNFQGEKDKSCFESQKADYRRCPIQG